MKKYLPLILLCCFYLSACDVDTSRSTLPKADTTRWEYGKSEDRMTSDTTFFASNHTKDQSFFGYYQVGNKYGLWPELTLQHSEGKSEVVLRVTHNFKPSLSGVFYGETILARFDKEKAIRFNISPPDNGRYDVVFIEPASKFIAHVKKAKKLMIEASFVGGGRNPTKILEFDVAGLKWNYKR